MPLPALLEGRLKLPVIAAPMFIISGPDLVIAACKAGIVGAFPALNARPDEVFPQWLDRIEEELAEAPDAAPYAVNLIVNQTNKRLDKDLAVCVEHKVPVVITSMRPPQEVVPAVHAYGGIVLHDVISARHAEKAIEQGVDGIVAVCAGAGGHTGPLNPFALVAEIRRMWKGPLILSGALANGRAVLGAQAMGADLAYMGTRFIATQEASANPAHKQMIVETTSKDVLCTSFFSGLQANYLKPSIAASGLDPDALPNNQNSYTGRRATDANARPWRDVWGGGHGVGLIDDIPTVAECVERLKIEYDAAKADFRRALA